MGEGKCTHVVQVKGVWLGEAQIHVPCRSVALTALNNHAGLQFNGVRAKSSVHNTRTTSTTRSSSCYKYPRSTHSCIVLIRALCALVAPTDCKVRHNHLTSTTAHEFSKRQRCR